MRLKMVGGIRSNIAERKKGAIADAVRRRKRANIADTAHAYDQHFDGGEESNVSSEHWDFLSLVRKVIAFRTVGVIKWMIFELSGHLRMKSCPSFSLNYVLLII